MPGGALDPAEQGGALWGHRVQVAAGDGECLADQRLDLGRERLSTTVRARHEPNSVTVEQLP
jgi:hypothetical protein